MRFHPPLLTSLAALLLALGPATAADSAAGHAAPAAAPLAPSARALLAAKPVRASPADEAAGKGPVAAAATAAPLSDADSMDRLRTRLADKLSARTLSPAHPGEMRVVARVAPAARAPVRAGVVTGNGGRATPSKAGEPALPAPHWGYIGPAGPQTWGGLRPEFALCANGQRQSPIDIRGGLPVDLEPVKFDYKPTRFGVVDNGHTVQVNLQSGNAIEVNGRRFELQQFHFHRPSEERIDGRQFEMSLHLVHKDPEGRLAVVTLLFDKGPEHALLQRVWSNLPLERHEENQARSTLDVNELLPEDRRYYTYMGSLTTPPCTEGVQWVVMRQPVSAAAEQIELFARIYPMNARPVQSAAGRRILQSN